MWHNWSWDSLLWQVCVPGRSCCVLPLTAQGCHYVRSITNHFSDPCGNGPRTKWLKMIGKPNTYWAQTPSSTPLNTTKHLISIVSFQQLTLTAPEGRYLLLFHFTDKETKVTPNGRSQAQGGLSFFTEQREWWTQNKYKYVLTVSK